MVRLMYADDEKKMRQVLDKIIDWEGLGIEKICSCEDGDELINNIILHKPDIVLTDMRMPGLSGKKLLAKIREINQDVRLIIISGYDDFEYLKQSIVTGAEDYILKPVDKDELNRILKQIIEKINVSKENTKQIEAERNSKLFDAIINDSVRLEKFDSIMEISENEKLYFAYVCSWNKGFGSEKVYRKIEKYLECKRYDDIAIIKDTLNNGNFACI